MIILVYCLVLGGHPLQIVAALIVPSSRICWRPGLVYSNEPERHNYATRANSESTCEAAVQRRGQLNISATPQLRQPRIAPHETFLFLHTKYLTIESTISPTTSIHDAKTRSLSHALDTGRYQGPFCLTPLCPSTICATIVTSSDHIEWRRTIPTIVAIPGAREGSCSAPTKDS